jgi:hypothetical protein
VLSDDLELSPDVLSVLSDDLELSPDVLTGQSVSALLLELDWNLKESDAKNPVFFAAFSVWLTENKSLPVDAAMWVSDSAVLRKLGLDGWEVI